VLKAYPRIIATRSRPFLSIKPPVESMTAALIIAINPHDEPAENAELPKVST
jgi:hypothetical protein